MRKPGKPLVWIATLLVLLLWGCGKSPVTPTVIVVNPGETPPPKVVSTGPEVILLCNGVAATTCTARVGGIASIGWEARNVAACYRDGSNTNIGLRGAWGVGNIDSPFERRHTIRCVTQDGKWVEAEILLIAR